MTLTPRQVEVLDMVAMGFGDKEIADKLGISVETVDFHVREIFVRLSAKTRAHAVAIHILTEAGAL
jgi:LuxR family transcriptional regulator, regulator of acetate metabolism